MNEMKHFFNTTSVDTIGECLNGEKLLNASRNEKGNTLLTFESAYEGYSDLLTITPDGSVIGTFICDEEQQHAKEPSMELVITPKVTTGGVPVLSVEVNDLPTK